MSWAPLRGPARVLDRLAGRATPLTEPAPSVLRAAEQRQSRARTAPPPGEGVRAAASVLRSAEQRQSRRGTVTRRVARVVGALVLGCTAVVVAPGTANAVPIVGGCTTPPTPESPRQGISGFFMSAPDPLPATEDPFAGGAKTTPFER